MPRTVSILGATGSIGQNTIDLIKRAPNDFEVLALTGGRNLDQLATDAVALNAKFVATCYPERYQELADRLSSHSIKVGAGSDAILEAALMPADWVMSGIVGAAGLLPGVEVLKRGATLALANKETLVAAGPIVMELARKHGATILPVDSEHSAVFQALIGEDIASVERIIITASGGAFRDWPIADLGRATLAQASSHPNWDMGQRITIDSASMFNKGLELIETKEFFGVEPNQIETIIHPESMIHAMVGFNDGALMAHVGPPDMRHAIGFALHWPDRKTLPVERLDFAKLGQLSFRAPDDARYPALRLARRAMEQGGLTGAVFNAAKERALDHFIDGKIKFTEMAEIVEAVMDTMSTRDGLENATLTLETVLEADHIARVRADEAMDQSIKG